MHYNDGCWTTGGGQAAEGANPPLATSRQGKRSTHTGSSILPPVAATFARVKASESLPPHLPHHCTQLSYAFPPSTADSATNLYRYLNVQRHKLEKVEYLLSLGDPKMGSHPYPGTCFSQPFTPSPRAGTPFLWPAHFPHWPRLGNSTTVMLSSVETNWANVAEDQSMLARRSSRDVLHCSCLRSPSDASLFCCGAQLPSGTGHSG
ncbi:hypothetical protein GE09DRAFT_779459 [Coniochaeta sp. 2T2.1]|nr:hypothetical protein GE09DRAFT_779459 [Coniochaeta sp. 2T2.1]